MPHEVMLDTTLTFTWPSLPPKPELYLVTKPKSGKYPEPGERKDVG